MLGRSLKPSSASMAASWKRCRVVRTSCTLLIIFNLSSISGRDGRTPQYGDELPDWQPRCQRKRPPFPGALGLLPSWPLGQIALNPRRFHPTPGWFLPIIKGLAFLLCHPLRHSGDNERPHLAAPIIDDENPPLRHGSHLNGTWC